MEKRKYIEFGVLILAAVTAIVVGASHGISNRDFRRGVQKDETIFYIVRHAETEANVNGILVGSGGDSELTDNGKDQAKRLGTGLNGTRFDKCYTSEMGRAHTTAEIILENSNNQNTEIYEDHGLNDLDWGDLEGQSIADISSWWPNFSIEAAIGDGSDTDFTSVSGSETRYACTKRITDEMNHLATEQENAGKRILVVAHSSMAWFIDSVAGDDSKDYTSIDNASVSVLVYRNGSWQIVDFNDTDYSSMSQRLIKY